jgi:pilus assembly protein CpaC
MLIMSPSPSPVRSAPVAFALALAFAAAAAPAPAFAQLVSEAMPAQTLEVAKDKSVAFRVSYPVGEIAVAQPDVLQLVATTDQSFYVRGKAVGSTNLLVYDRSHRLMQVVDVRVGLDTGSLQSDIDMALPGEHITAVNFANGVLLRGEASTIRAAQRAWEIAERYAPKAVSSEVTIKAAEQVMVEVRILEANRTALKDLGVNLNASNKNLNLATGVGILDSQPPMGTIGLSGTFHGVSIDATLTALEQKGVVRTLAKPNLMAMSGEEASFLAGGEFPYPVPAGVNLVTIEFKPFGVKLNVTPTIQDNGQIRLKVAPEVSELDPRHQLQLDGFTLPSLTERKAETMVELKDGQSFAVAGLLQQDYINAVSQLPWAGDIPVLGALFKSASYKRDETELVIIVTPHLVAPADRLEDIHTPLGSNEEPDLVTMLLTDRAFDKPFNKPVTSEGRK